MGRFEVNFSEWQACVNGGGCLREPDDHRWGRKGRPVINVTYFDAKRYLEWISKKTGKRYRLPSEAEWEYADRGGTLPHGSAPVGSFAANPFGIHDTAGNVFEWVEDCWNTSHKNAPKNGTARTEGNCKYRVLRGGSFYYYSKVAKTFYRAKNPPGVKSYWLGFRVLRELD